MKCPSCQSSIVQFESRTRVFASETVEVNLNIVCHKCKKYHYITTLIETKGQWNPL
jgi:uncharacterized protein with PIN domain